MKRNYPEIYASLPCVFAIGNEYSVILPVKEKCLMWVNVGGKRYCDHDNGIMRGTSVVHKVSIPTEVLDREKKYTVVTRRIIDRKPYFPEIEPEVSETFEFCPVPTDGKLRLVCISDSHSLVKEPIAAARKAGKIDLLILNGDVPNDSSTLENIFTIYKIVGAITGGEIPTVFSRGNHDLRGVYADCLSDYVPSCGGKTYYTFRVGSLWGMVLDCGEDKYDSHAEYGGTVCCELFRREETEFIREVIANAENEYAADGVKNKIIVAHCPFVIVGSFGDDVFDIEKDVYAEWTRLVSDNIRPDVMLFGHKHVSEIITPGSEKDMFGMSCDAVISGIPNHAAKSYECMSVNLDNGKYSCEFLSAKGE